MTYWEVLFNVFAVIWSPSAITILGIVVGAVLVLIALDEFEYGEVWAGFAWLVAGLIVGAAALSFIIWLTGTGVHPLGWHYPINR